jgi:GNAT superfamily N-acetyltransferase
MEFGKRLESVFFGFYGNNVEIDISPKSDSPWNLNISFKVGDFDLMIRNLEKGDENNLRKFGKSLSDSSKNLFCPYPWENDSNLGNAFAEAIDNSVRKVDASYLVFDGKNPVSHFFLWKAGGNDYSLRHGVEVPELGVAVSDKFQGSGIGSLVVNILKEVGSYLKRDGIELTTSEDNKGGWNLYRKSGFIYTGNILNPLEVDVTGAVEEGKNVERVREERQMMYLIDSSKKVQILEYLKSKRKESGRLFGKIT